MPLALPVGNNGEATPVEDYTLAAASWTLTAHEIRPGHELQFDAMIANGTSMTRRSVGVMLANPEGWAVYAAFYAGRGSSDLTTVPLAQRSPGVSGH
jgi:hypothetical protein